MRVTADPLFIDLILDFDQQVHNQKSKKILHFSYKCDEIFLWCRDTE